MMQRGGAAVVLAVWLFSPSLGRAGLYSTEVPPQGEKIPRKGVHNIAADRFVRDYLPELMWIGRAILDDIFKEFVGLTKAEQERRVQEKTKTMSPDEQGRYLSQYKFWLLRRQYIERKEALQRKARQGRLTIEDRIDLSFYLLRLNDSVHAAIGVLKAPEAQASRHFMVYANLASAYMALAENSAKPRDRAENFGYALLYLRQTQEAWPKEWRGWTPEQRDWYGEAEKEEARLVRLRWKEALGQVRQPLPDGRPFEKPDDLFSVNFVGESGEFEPGKLAAAERKKLTGKELAIVQQLLTWSPRDSRLYWLLGELVNARGDQAQTDVLTAWRILEDIVQNLKVSNVPLLMKHRHALYEAVAARPAPTSWLPEFWQWALVGSLGGVIIAFLAYFQIKELRRRRQRAAAERKP
jgi:hypothetical protein